MGNNRYLIKKMQKKSFFTIEKIKRVPSSARAETTKSSRGLQVRDEQGNSGLHLACSHKHANIVRLLMHHKVSGNLQNPLVPRGAKNKYPPISFNWLLMASFVKEMV